MTFISVQDCCIIVHKHFNYINSQDNNIKEEDIIDFKVNEISTCDKIAKNGHLGEYHRLRISLRNEQQLQFFVKQIITSPNRPEFVNLVTQKEIGFYRWFFAAVEETGLEPPTFLPKFYFATDTFIVLEDLENYKTAPNKNQLCYDHLKVAIDCLTQFHAYVLYFKLQYKIENPLPSLSEAMFTTNSYMGPIANGISRHLTDLGHPQEVVDMFQSAMNHTLDLFNTDGEPNDQNELKIICHGDLWSNNMLFSYDNTEKSLPVTCKLIDYQLIRYAQPAHDLCTLLIHNSDNCNHFGELCNRYYHSLHHESHKLGLKLEDHWGRISFESSIKPHAKAALITKLISASFGAATRLRTIKFQSNSNIPLDNLMSQDNYNFITDVCNMDEEQNQIFCGLIVQLIQMLNNAWITIDVVHRLLYEYNDGVGFTILDYSTNKNVITINFANNKTIKTIKFQASVPNKFYDGLFVPRGNSEYPLQICHLYQRDDLMIMEFLDSNYKKLNSRQPFGLDEVRCALDALAEIHIISYVNRTMIDGFPLKDQPNLHELNPLFKFLKIDVNWAIVMTKLEVDRKTRQLIVLHNEFDYRNIYFRKNKFDLESPKTLTDQAACKITLGNNLCQGLPCEDVLSFLLHVTTKPFRDYTTNDILRFYYDCLVTKLSCMNILPFTLEEFYIDCDLYRPRAIIDGLIYHQTALIDEKRLVNGDVIQNDPSIENEIESNYYNDPVYKERIDDMIHEFQIVFKDCL